MQKDIIGISSIELLMQINANKMRMCQLTFIGHSI